VLPDADTNRLTRVTNPPRFIVSPSMLVLPPLTADAATSSAGDWREELAAQGRIWRRHWQHQLRTPWRFRGDWPVAVPLVVMAVLTLIFCATSLDQTVAGWFYQPSSGTWPWEFCLSCTAFYRLGVFPPFLLAICGIAMLVGGRWLEPTGSVQRAGLFLVLLMAVAPGLIVNIGLKEFWGRARPHQVREFGGRHSYSMLAQPGSLPTGNSSFPSGHAAIAFYMIAPGFLVSRRRPQWATWWFLGGTAFGLCMSASRVMQGAHFASDVVWGGAIVYFTGVLLSRLLLSDSSRAGG